jgi:ribosomal protein S21
LRQTFAPDEKCMRPLKNVCAKPLRLMKMYAAFEKMELKRKKKLEIKIKRKQMNDHKFQRDEN